MYQLNSTYKIFWDLQFNVQEGFSKFPPRIQARIKFDNGYGISVVRGSDSIIIEGSLLHNTTSYEIAVLGKNDKLDYSTPITNDVEAGLTLDEVTEYMIKIQQL
jgi:hypothetical protein